MSWPVKLQVAQGRGALRQIVGGGRQNNVNKAPLGGALGSPPPVVVRDWLKFGSVAGGGAALLWPRKWQVPGCDSGHATTINSKLPLRGLFSSPSFNVDLSLCVGSDHQGSWASPPPIAWGGHLRQESSRHHQGGYKTGPLANAHAELLFMVEMSPRLMTQS